MPSLADLQCATARAVLGRDLAALPATVAGRVPASAALDVHHATVTGALVNALRLVFPTVAALVGDDYFTRLTCLYSDDRPRARSRLDDLGDGFVALVEAMSAEHGLPYLADVARLDHMVDTALRAEDASVTRVVPIEPRLSLAVPLSLSTLVAMAPVDEIRAAVLAEDDTVLAAIDPSRRPIHLVVWRDGRMAVVARLSPPSGMFLSGLLAGAGPDDALAAALTTAAADALDAIRTEVFGARFAQIIHHHQGAA